jgi:hypothetical protein
MNTLTEMLAQHRALREDMRLLGSDDRRHAKAVQKSDRIVRKLAKMSCASDEEFFTKLAHIAKVEFKDYGDPEGQNYEGMLIAVRSYLAQRKKNAQDTYARLVLQGYFRPGALERAAKMLRPGLAALLAPESPKETGIAAEKTKEDP